MAFLDLHKLTNVKDLSAGKILIAEPFLNDPNFARSVVLICEYSDEGTVGLVLNRPTDIFLPDVMPDMMLPEISIAQGGPVQLDTMQMLHNLPEHLGGKKIAPSVYWGGDFDKVSELSIAGLVNPNSLKLYLGYSGWSKGQLEEELKSSSWLIGDVSNDLVFLTDVKNIWQFAIRSLGSEYEYLTNLPTDPQLN